MIEEVFWFSGVLIGEINMELPCEEKNQMYSASARMYSPRPIRTNGVIMFLKRWMRVAIRG
jgi:hypothetical protein